ncbi:hypothetical protein [Neisseria sp. 74A18]|uniref:hypothetical protein n=1 Tax=Neisseria sp. 74A18 TaxID=1696094 RepID=UPI0006CAF3E7|nr:hypothetical protein [Neisseria sp. 74A18]KPN74048.1 hypothetical protein AKG43_04455 [Neisseria sp. 74A18]
MNAAAQTVEIAIENNLFGGLMAAIKQNKIPRSNLNKLVVPCLLILFSQNTVLKSLWTGQCSKGVGYKAGSTRFGYLIKLSKMCLDLNGKKVIINEI